MGDLDTLYRCSYGSAGFQLRTYSYSEKQVILSNALFAVRIGKEITVEAEGWVEGSDPVAFNQALWEIKRNLAINAQDFTITGPSDLVEVSIIAARCIEGGPEVEFQVSDLGYNRRAIKFKVLAKTARVGSGGEGNDDTPPGEDDDTAADDAVNYTFQTSTRPDGLKTVTRTGEIRGPNVVSRFNTVLLQFQQSFRPGAWVVSHQYDTNQPPDALKYTLVAVELRDQLPGIGTVDGTARTWFERDEQMRFVGIWDYDLLIGGGDYGQVLATIRANLSQYGTPVHAVESISSGRERRLTASYTFLMNRGRGTPLLNYTESLDVEFGEPVWELKQYPGVKPILVEQSMGMSIVSQSGSCISVGAFAQPPGPLYPHLLMEPMAVSMAILNDFEKQTTWTYRMAVPVGQGSTGSQGIGSARAIVERMAALKPGNILIEVPRNGGA